MWCPQCGDEFRAGFDRCSDCGVALVGLRPAPVAPVAEDQRAVRTDHVLLEYDLADWSDDERHGLELQLRLAAIPAAWEDATVLVVGRAWQREVDELVDFIEAGPDRDAHEPAAGAARTSMVASPGRRLFGAVVDDVAAAIGWAIAAPLTGPRPGLFIAIVVSAAYWVVPAALWGRSLGKLAVGTRIRRVDGVRPPGWWVAFVRWGVVVGPVFVATFLWASPKHVTSGSSVVTFTWGAVVALAWLIVVFAPILGRSRRGLHDRAAGTDVVRARFRKESNHLG